MELRTESLKVLQMTDPAGKAAATRRLRQQWNQGQVTLRASASMSEPEGLPGRPEHPKLLPAREVPSRTPFTLEGRAALLHAVCHIEFNAINLALDAIWRFAELPDSFYVDWLQVADEEAVHFTLLRQHLLSLGRDYGDFPAHDGLWSMAERTRHDVVARMALVPRTLEARGLDATPPMQARLRQAGDLAAADILDIILRDEIGHVAIGNHWYRWLCTHSGQDAEALFPELARRYDAPRIKGQLNLEARRQAGFSASELAQWMAPGGTSAPS